jgi:hypothetical protein
MRMKISSLKSGLRVRERSSLGQLPGDGGRYVHLDSTAVTTDGRTGFKAWTTAAQSSEVDTSWADQLEHPLPPWWCLQVVSLCPARLAHGGAAERVVN